MRPTLLLLGSGQAEYRRYGLERITRHYDIALLTAQPITWEHPFLVDHQVLATLTRETALPAASAMAGRHIAGVLTYHEPYVSLAALIAESLGVARCDPRAIARCRDKLASREALRRAGVPSANAVLAGDAQQAARSAAQIGYPVVVKPRALAASFGVSVVSDPRELAAAFECARNASLPEIWDYQGDVLIEEYLDGPEISVDSVVFRGTVEPIIYAKKELGFAPYFEEIGHIVGPATSVADDPDAVGSVVAAAHAALGIDNTVTHTELRLTRRGPRVVEVNGRSGGDLIPYLGYLASEVDVPLASADLAAGREPRIGGRAPAEHGSAGIRFFYPHQDGRVDIASMEPGFTPPSWLDQLTWLVKPGTEVQLPPRSFFHCRLGFAIVTAGSVRQCAARLAEIEKNAILTLTPLESMGGL